MRDDIDARLQIVEDMLTAILKSQNNIHWIGGYVYGKTKGGDPFVVLYPAAEYLVEKACRVYPREFNKLPPFIPTQNVNGKTKSNPNKQEAQDLGIYNACPMFQVLTYDGKDTPLGKEKRFGKVVRVTSKMPNSGRAHATEEAPDEPEDISTPEPTTNPPTLTRPLTLPEIKHFQREARTATDEFLFVTAVNRLHPDYTTDRLSSLRAGVCTDAITALNAPAQLEAVEKYIARRKELEKSGVPISSAHATAKTDAAAAYARLRGETQS